MHSSEGNVMIAFGLRTKTISIFESEGDDVDFLPSYFG